MSQAYEPLPAPNRNSDPVFPADPNAVPNSGPPTNAKNGRCLLYGCVGVFVGGLMLILCAGFGTYFAVRKQVEKYTAAEPKDLPAVEYSDERLAELDTRLESFQAELTDEQKVNAKPEFAGDETTDQTNVDSEPEPEAKTDLAVVAESLTPTPTRELVLTANDINALIAREEKLRGRLLVKVADGKVTGDVSIPIDSFVPGSKGRYFNGSGTFGVRLEDGVLVVNLESAEVKGEPIPEAFMQGLRKENLAKEVYKDEKSARIMRRFESIRVEDDKIIAKIREK